MKAAEREVRKVQKQLEAEYGRPITLAEAQYAIERQKRLGELLAEGYVALNEQWMRLKDSPKGFHPPEGQYTCRICERGISAEETWYDKNGYKCMTCQRAVDEQIIPADVDEHDWYSLRDLKRYHDVQTRTAFKLIREGKLKARIIPDADGSAYFYMFLVAENQPVLKPKPEPTVVQDGNIYYVSRITPQKLKI